MIKAVIFDCYGVLAGSAYTEIFQRAGGDLVQDGQFLQDTLTAANGGFITSADMNQRVAEKLGMTPTEWRECVRLGELPNEQLLAYAGELRERGLKTAVLSNANIGSLERTFQPGQLASFDAVIVSAQVRLLKPDVRIYELAAEQLGVEPSACVFTDDNPDYAAASENAGMTGLQYQGFVDFQTKLEDLLANHKL